ncbi:MAG: c-type cytochrome [Planctomycetia bacterium]|nr:c-type cytochrome [Planctomycetia bacterium]
MMGALFRRRLATSIALGMVAIAGAMLASGGAAADDKPAKSDDGRLTREEAKKLKTPVPYSKESIVRGKNLYIRKCTECHGADAKSQVDVVANATDLTEPKLWKSGTSEGEIFRSIRDGAGEAMPPFKAEVEKEKDIWDMANFLRSLWPAPMRPKLSEATSH